MSLVCVLAAGCEGGPRVVLGDDPVGDSVLGPVGGAGGAGIEGPQQERDLHWARGQDGVVRGRLHGTAFNRMVVDDQHGDRHFLKLSPGTVIRRGGEPSSALVLEPGVEVEATFLTWKGSKVVAEVQVLAPPGRPAAN